MSVVINGVTYDLLKLKNKLNRHKKETVNYSDFEWFLLVILYQIYLFCRTVRKKDEFLFLLYLSYFINTLGILIQV